MNKRHEVAIHTGFWTLIQIRPSEGISPNFSVACQSAAIRIAVSSQSYLRADTEVQNIDARHAAYRFRCTVRRVCANRMYHDYPVF